MLFFNVFARSWKGLNLSPGERALMKFSEGILITAVGAGVAVAYQQLATGSIDISKIGLVAGGAAGLTVFNTIKKYTASQSDVPLPAPSLAGPPVDVPTPEPVQPPAPQPQPGNRFTTPVPLPPSQYIPMPQAGGAYVPPPAYDPNWSGMVPSVSSQTTLPQVPTP
jgi:hypothetical protein